MSTFELALRLVALAVVGATVLWLALRSRDASTQEARLEHMGKVSEALTKGVALLTAVLAIVAAREGGLGRLAANGEGEFGEAVVCVIASVLLAFVAWMVVAAAPARAVVWLWLTVTFASVALFGASVYGVLRAHETASEKLERPSITFEQGPQGLKLTASIDLLGADQFMRTTVYGWPPGDAPGELLFNSTTGPDAKGRASITGVVAQPLARYEAVEARAFRGLFDPGCEKPREGAPRETGPAACASIWITPKPGA